MKICDDGAKAMEGLEGKRSGRLLVARFLKQAKAETLFLSLVAIAFTVTSLHKTTSIKLGPVDDHEIVRFLGADRALSIWEILTVYFQETEVGQWGNYGRFRPVYYLLRLLETSIFGSSPSRWFLARIGLVSCTLILAAMLIGKLSIRCTRPQRLSLCVLVMIGLLSQSSWTDVATRLGPSEIYLGVIFVGFLVTVVALLEHPANTTLWTSLLLLAVSAAGVKENAVAFLLPVVIAIALRSFSIRRLTASTVVSGVISIALILLIFLGPVLSYSRVGSDIYGQQRSVRKSLLLVIDFLSDVRTLPILVVTATCWLVATRVRELKQLLLKHAVLMALLLYFLVTEFVFYQGVFGESRYALVSQVSRTLFTATTLSALLCATKSTFLTQRQLVQRGALALVFSSLIATSQTYFSADAALQNAIKQRIDSTNRFDQSMTRLKKLLNSDKVERIVIQVESVADYESAYAVSHYATFLGGGLPKYMTVSIDRSGSGLGEILLNQLETISRNGSDDWQVSPWTHTPTQGTLCIKFADSDASQGICDQVIQI